ncbi:tryptophan-rich sensory protein [Candidatus Roizmanbacteria bacterium]|nr:tryptophan-rich sensory protein [Candidatus Roizmanbacteria bacterium]
MSKTSKLVTAVLGCELVGILSIPFTFVAIPTWYVTLNKPAFSPPNWIFGPVWTALYFMMGVAAYLVWQKGLKNKKVRRALVYFLLQLGFNFFWSIIFFGLRQPLLAFVDIVLLWGAIFITIMQFSKLSKPAAYLMIPYLLWVSFAMVLNLSIVSLNR